MFATLSQQIQRFLMALGLMPAQPQVVRIDPREQTRLAHEARRRR